MNDLSFTFYRLFAAAWRRRYAIVLPILVLPFIGLFVSQSSSKTYHSHTSMLIQETSKMNPFLEEFSVSALLKERMASLKTLLHSRHILTNVALKLGLINEQTPANEKDEIIAKLSSSLSVQMLGKDLISIEFKTDQLNNIKETLEIVSEQFIEQLLAPERSSMAGSMKFLGNQLDIRRKDIEQAETQLGRFKNQYAEVLPELFTDNISRLTSLKQKLAEKQASYAGVKKNLGSIDAQLSTSNPVIAKLEQQIVDTNNNLVLLRARYTDKHSDIQATLLKLKSLEDERQKFISNNKNSATSPQSTTTELVELAYQLKQNINSDDTMSPILMAQLHSLQTSRNKFDSLEEEIKTLQIMIKSLQQKSNSFGSLESEYSKLERDLKVKRDLYDELLNRFEMARITGSLSDFEQHKRIKIIDKPFQPTSSSNFPTLFFFIGGILGGLFLGIGLAIFLELLDNSIRYKNQVEDKSNVPFLGRISKY